MATDKDDELYDQVKKIIDTDRADKPFLYKGTDNTCRKLTELEVGRTLVQYLQWKRMMSEAEIALNDKKINGDELPPDVEVRTALGKNVGIEITELIDKNYIKARQKEKKKGEAISSDDRFSWHGTKFQKDLTCIVHKKDRTTLKVKEQYDELILLIEIYDFWLDYEIAMALVSGVNLSSRVFNSGYLFLPYDPKVDKQEFPEGYPIIKLF